MVPAGAAAPFLSARCAHPRFLRAAARLRLPGARGAWFGRCGRGLIVCACAVSRAAAAGALRVWGGGARGGIRCRPWPRGASYADCVTCQKGVTIAVNVAFTPDDGNLYNAVHDHPVPDTFLFAMDGGTSVCAGRTDASRGRGMNVQISCKGGGGRFAGPESARRSAAELEA